ncbi:MAG TPA: hypothetical protein VL461_11530 [Dictyobacter sp.]|jgi:hypothetical protein|nr:hypothetical protein [Dictyobacter sp.]
MKERSEMKLRSLARKGNQDAAHLLALREACQRTLQATDDLDLALGIDPDVDDVLNGFMDDAYGEFLPPLLKRAGGVSGLYWHTDPLMLLMATATWYKEIRGEYPAELSIHEQWKERLEGEETFSMEETKIKINYVDKDPDGSPLTSQIAMMAVFTPMDYERKQK